jgi:hypothetical protein
MPGSEMFLSVPPLLGSKCSLNSIGFPTAKEL